MSNNAEPPDLVSIIMKASRAQVEAIMARLAVGGFDDMTSTFATVLPLIDSAGIRPGVLAQQTGVTKQAVSQLVRLLVKRKYVELAPDATDTRAKVVRLTKRGVEVKKACTELHDEFEQLAVKILGKKALARLQHDLDKYTNWLSSSAIEPHRTAHPRNSGS